MSPLPLTFPLPLGITPAPVTPLILKTPLNLPPIPPVSSLPLPPPLPTRQPPLTPLLSAPLLPCFVTPAIRPHDPCRAILPLTCQILSSVVTIPTPSLLFSLAAAVTVVLVAVPSVVLPLLLR